MTKLYAKRKPCDLVSGLQRKTEPVGCVCSGVCVERGRRKEEEGERLVYFKEFSLTVVVAGKSKICRAGWQAGGPGRVAV